MLGGIRECRGHWGGKLIGTTTTLGPSPGSQHSHWFPLGSDLPHQGQARAPFQGPITSTGLPWGVTYLAKAKQVTEMSSAVYYIHLELYLVTVCTFVSMLPIYAYPYTNNLMYYNAMVLIMKNYFSHKTSELGTSDCKCQADLM